MREILPWWVPEAVEARCATMETEIAVFYTGHTFCYTLMSVPPSTRHEDRILRAMAQVADVVFIWNGARVCEPVEPTTIGQSFWDDMPGFGDDDNEPDDYYDDEEECG